MLSLPNQYRPWLGWLIVTFFYAYQYLLRVVPSILMTDITQKFSLTPEAFGQFSGVYYLGYSLSHIPIGIFLDRIGPKRTVPIFILLTVLGILPLILSDVWIYPVLGRILIGIGSSGAVLSVFKVIQMTFDENKFSRILSLSVTVSLFGAIYGGGPIHLLRSNYGFQSVIISLVLGGVGLSILSYLLIPASKSVQKETSVFLDLRLVLGNKQVILLCILAGLMVGPLEGFADVWGTQFLKIVYGFDAQTASTLPSFIFLGMCFGGPFLCSLAERKGRHLEVVLGSAIFMTTAFTFLIFTRWSSTTLTLLFLMVGVCCAYQIIIICKVSKTVSSHLSGMATSISNMIIMIFGYIFHSSIGRIVGNSGSFESSGSLTLGVSIIPLSLFISTIGLIFYIFSKNFTPVSQRARLNNSR